MRHRYISILICLFLPLALWAQSYRDVFPYIKSKDKIAILDFIAGYARQNNMGPLADSHVRLFVQPMGVIKEAIDIDLVTGRTSVYPGTGSKDGYCEMRIDSKNLSRLRGLLSSDAFRRLPAQGSKIGMDGQTVMIEVNLDGSYFWKLHWMPDDPVFVEIIQFIMDRTKDRQKCLLISKERVRMEQKINLPSEVEGWKISGQLGDYDPDTVFRYMDGAAELYRAYNMKSLTVARYERKGYPSVIAEIYQMGSSKDAYGVFSFEQDDPEAGVGQGSEFGGGLLRFWKGDIFVSVYGENIGAEVESATLTLGQKIAASIKKTGQPPAIIKLVPEEIRPFLKKRTWFVRSHILLNQRFFIAQRNVLGLEKDVEAVLCRYEADKEKAILLLIRYPSQAKAESAFSGFKRSYMPDVKEKNAIRTENNKWTTLKRYNDFIIIAFDMPDELLAEQLIKKTHDNLQKEE